MDAEFVVGLGLEGEATRVVDELAELRRCALAQFTGFELHFLKPYLFNFILLRDVLKILPRQGALYECEKIPLNKNMSIYPRDSRSSLRLNE